MSEESKKIVLPAYLIRRFEAFRIVKGGEHSYLLRDKIQGKVHDFDAWQFFILEVLPGCESFEKLQVVFKDRFDRDLSRKELDELADGLSRSSTAGANGHASGRSPGAMRTLRGRSPSPPTAIRSTFPSPWACESRTVRTSSKSPCGPADGPTAIGSTARMLTAFAQSSTTSTALTPRSCRTSTIYWPDGPIGLIGCDGGSVRNARHRTRT